MDRVVFRVNGELHSVGCEVRSDLSLLEYLRVGSELRGTKYMCRQGGCGACVVSAARPGDKPRAVNSCLVSVTSCHDWSITTIEGVGNRLKGYHPLQTTLAKYNGTQCGSCTPGWIMAMYSLLQSKKKLTMLEIEQSFGSNICRCTGYRPILEAFKRFACDAPDRLLDIEDLSLCQKTGQSCRKTSCSDSDWCVVEAEDVNAPQHIEFELKDGKSWTKVLTVKDIFEVLQRKGDDSYMLVAGNTAKGAYPIDQYPRVLIDISDVSELKGYRLDQNLMLGAGCTLIETLNIFEYLANVTDGFQYLEKLRQHLLMVAHIPVRNLGTIAGNLMIKYQHREFQSDVFLLLEAVGAYLTIVDSYGTQIKVTPVQFLNVDMRGKVIVNVLLPPLSRNYKFVSFKIMARSENVIAIVHSAFLFRLTPDFTVSEARVVYGALSPGFVHASNTEKFLIGKKLFTDETLQGALRVLNSELVVAEMPPEPSAVYRKNLAINLFYKIQCAGEAPYTEDVPCLPREVFGAFVLADVPLGNIINIDPSEAFKCPGVIAFYSAKDIPGVNSFVPDDLYMNRSLEEIFCSGPVKYNGQVIGVIVAELRAIAEFAAKRVRVRYSNVRNPDTDVKKSKNNPRRTTLIKEFKGSNKGTDVFRVIQGEETMYHQNHFCIETLVSVAKPTEEGLKVYCATQHMDIVQVMISRALKIPENKIDVYVRRLGGAFGIKVTRISLVAVVSALVATKLNRPCRILMPLETLSRAIGKRLPCSTEYEVAVNKQGKIQYVNECLYQDNGYVANEPTYTGVFASYYSCYDKSLWNCKVLNVTTDTACNTPARAPGSLEAISAAEFILERIAYELSIDPIELRLRNLGPDSTVLKEMTANLITDAQYVKRRAAVDKYNTENRWKKRGLRFSVMRHNSSLTPHLNVILSVYQDDGTVAITHGGIEMGQGVNTKAVQIAAFVLGIPVEKIQVKANDTMVAPNARESADSVTSMNVGVGVKLCCKKLLAQLAPIRTKMPNATWEELVKAAFEANISLQTHGFVSDAPKSNTYGATLSEVEVDVLTGEWEVLRVDLLEDAGLSISPGIDIGQVEGAFTMGLGYWTSEHIVLNSNTGQVLTDRTWNYHVPLARDIPQDFRIYFKENSFSHRRVLGGKAIGEPPALMSVSVPFALREAIAAARCDAGIPTTTWFQIDGPYTREAVQMNTATNYSDFKLQ